MIDMWNWLLESYKEGSLTIEDMENILTDERKAEDLWEEFAWQRCDFVDFVRSEIKGFLKHLKKQEKDNVR